MSHQPDLTERVRRALGSSDAHRVEHIQSLWSGYGSIVRYGFSDPSAGSVIVKSVELPEVVHHPRGWSSSRSHQRKLESYQVEGAWYRLYARRCGERCRVAHCHHFEETSQGWLFVLEDLDAAGYPLRCATPSDDQFEACLAWLAHFHASFLIDRQSTDHARPSTDTDGQLADEDERSTQNEAFEGLWPVGTYWHLATRPDEWHAMPDGDLRRAARGLDERLSRARFSTLVHGDAKVQNFCFSDPASRLPASVAAVDFQYVGGGCGMKDVAYFLSSCLTERECERRAEKALEFYFAQLRAALTQREECPNCDLLEEEWRELYPVAWADFVRFLQGWAPEHYKIHGYSLKMTERALSLS